MKRLSLVACALPLLFSCALFGGGSRELWQEREIEGVAWEDLLEVGRQAVVQARFPSVRVSPESGRVESGWKNELSPYSREERRERATILVESKGQSRFLVRARVEAEGNEEMKATMNPEEAKWKPREDNVEIARFLLQFVLRKTKDFGPSEEFYKREPWKERGHP